MKGIIRFSLNNKLAIWILTFIIVFAGLYAGMNMKQETLPDLEVPIVQVTTVYPGATPEEVVDQVTIPLEQRLQNLTGVEVVNSSSLENVSSITIEYNYDQDMDKAVEDLREAVSDLSLPSAVSEPNIMRISLNQFPVYSISVSHDSLSLEELTNVIQSQVQPALEGVEGVASAEVSGQYYTEVEIEFDQARLAEFGLTEDTVKAIVQASALRVPLGLFEMDQSEKSVVIDGSVSSIEALKELAIPVIPSTGATPSVDIDETGAQQTAPQDAMQAPAEMTSDSFALPTVALQDIAQIDVIGKVESISRTNGEDSIAVQIVKSPDANTVDVVHAAKDVLSQFEEQFEGIQFISMLDQAEPIEDSVETMLNKALFGAIFAVIVIMLFLRNIRTTLISIISIPLSLLIAILLLQMMDITLNMMTLGAMTVAIGRVVDDSIVVIENIYRRMSLKGETLKGKELVLAATREMFIPISSSTIVTIAVFLPLGTVSGMVGELFLPFALTIVFALLASLLVSITIVPMLGHALFRRGVSEKRQHAEEKPGRLAGQYKKLLAWTLNHKWITSFLAVALLVGSMFLVPVIGTSFLPEQENKYAMITYSPAPGELLEEVEQKALDAEGIILQHEYVTDMQYSVGGTSMFSQGPNKSALFYILFESNTPNFEDVKQELVAEIASQTSEGGQWAEMDMTGGSFGGNNMSLMVYGENLEQIEPVVDQLEVMMSNNDNFEKVETSLSETYDQYTLVTDQKRLSELGLTAGEIVMNLSPQRERPVLTKVSIDGKEYEVYIRTTEDQFSSIEELENTTIVNRLGMPVTLKDVVTIEAGSSPNTISRRNGQVYAEVSGDLVVTDIGKASSDLLAQVDELELPQGVTIETGGVTAQMEETFEQLGLAMAAAIAIVYLVLVITFGGGLAPFAILLSLPFAIIGALLGLFVAGETISVSAMMGALMLIGIVVTNAIVLIDRVIQKEKEGLSTRDAILEAAVTRLRPILMTALATIGALLPLAFGFEDAGMISKGLGVTVIGGLASSTVLTLVIVPIAYEVLMKLRRHRRDEAV